MLILYNIYNKIFLHYCIFSITNGVKKGFGFLFVLYLFSFFVSTCFCEYSVEYEENNGQKLSADHDLGTQKKYTFPELACTDLPKSEEGESFTLQQKKVLICAAFFTVCVIVLFQIMNAENHDLQNRVAQSEKQIEVLKKQLEGLSQPSTSVPSTCSAPSAGGWKRPANWQYGFGF